MEEVGGEWIPQRASEGMPRFLLLLLPPRLLPSKRTVSPKSVVSWTCLEFIVMVKPSTGLRGGTTRSPFSWKGTTSCHYGLFYARKNLTRHKTTDQDVLLLQEADIEAVNIDVDLVQERHPPAPPAPDVLRPHHEGR